MDDLVFILLILSFAMLVGSILGFGDILIFVPLTSLILDVRVAVVISSFWSFILSIFNAVKYRDFYDPPFLKKNVLAGIFGVIIGSFLIISAPLDWIELFLGIFIIVYVISKFIEHKKNKISPEDVIQEASLKDMYVYSGGFMYGFLGGLIGASGPINVITLEKTGHHKESFIANFALVSVILSLFKLSIFIWNALFPLELFLLFLLGLGVIAIVTRIGHFIAPRLPKQTFEIAILSLLLIMGFRFLILNVISLFF